MGDGDPGGDVGVVIAAVAVAVAVAVVVVVLLLLLVVVVVVVVVVRVLSPPHKRTERLENSRFVHGVGHRRAAMPIPRILLVIGWGRPSGHTVATSTGFLLRELLFLLLLLWVKKGFACCFACCLACCWLL